MSKEKIDPVNLVASEIFGVDPGKSNGGISKYKNGKIETWNMKDISDFTDLCDFWKQQKETSKQPLIFIEKISTFKADLTNVPPSKKDEYIGRQRNMDKLKIHYVELISAIKVAEIPFIEIMPYHWQYYLKIHIHNEDYGIRKKRYKDIASDWFPGIKVTNMNCDSLLLIEFAKRRLKYDMFWILQHIKKDHVKQKA